MKRRECDHEAASPNAAYCRTCGTRMTQFQVEINGEVVPPVPEPRVRRRRWSLRRKVAAAAAAVAVVGVVAFYQVQNHWYDPAGPVEELISVLETGDGPALRTMVAESEASEDVKAAARESPLLEAGALDTGYQPPTDMTVAGVEYGLTAGDDRTQRGNREHATVTVSYRLGGKARKADVAVSRQGSGAFRDWSIHPDALLADLTVDVWHTSDRAFSVAGVRGLKAASVVGLPGEYQVVAAPDALYRATAVDVTVPIGEDLVVSVDEPLPRESVADDIQDQVRAFVEDCAAGGPVENTCHFDDAAARSGTVPKKTVWDIQSYPVVELTPYKMRAPEALTHGEVEDYGVLAVTTAAAGKAVGKYSSVIDEPKTITAGIHIMGRVSVDDDGKPEFTATMCPPNQQICLMRDPIGD